MIFFKRVRSYESEDKELDIFSKYILPTYHIKMGTKII